MKIITRNIQPPIPTRQCDWCAFYEGEEERGGYGFGATEQGAIDDLLLRNQFQEGQEVEVHKIVSKLGWTQRRWRKAVIIEDAGKLGAVLMPEKDKHFWLVQFPDSTRAVFDDAHIRTATP